MNKIFGVILIVLGLCGLAYGGFEYKTREKVLDIGPIHATATKTHEVPLSPIFGVVAVAGGLALLLVKSR